MKSKGFTLIEMFVTVAIALILGGGALIGYNSAQKKLALDRSAFKLAQDIRRAQEMAMAQEPYDGTLPEGGYGIYLKKVPDPQTSYDFFMDLRESALDPPNRKYDLGNEKIETISFENGVQIKNLDANHINIIFAPPHPYIYFRDNDGNDLGDEVSIIISLEDDSTVTKTIKVNKAGLIYVEN